MADIEHPLETADQPQASSEIMSEKPSRKWPLYIVVAIITVAIFIGVGLMIAQANVILGYSGALQDQETLLIVDMNDAKAASIPLSAVLNQADQAFAEGKVSDALQYYERALELGGDVQVMRRMFDVAVLLGDQKKAESVLGLLAFRNIAQSTIDALRGFLHLRFGDIEGARTLFEEDAQRPEQAYGLLLVYILTGDHEKAKGSLSLLLQSNDPLLVHSARTIQGAYDEFALFEDGKTSHLNTLLARALAGISQCPAAENLLNKVVVSDPEYRDAWIVLGYCRLMIENADGALQAFDQAYALDPEKAETQFFLGLAYDRLGDEEKAHMFLGYALQNGFSPQRVVREKLAAMAVRQGLHLEAAEQYRSMLKDDEDGSLHHALVTMLVTDLHDPDGARSIALSARDAVGDTPFVLDAVGWTALLTGDNDQAASFLQSAVQQDPSMASAWYHKALLEEQVEEKDQALASYKKAYDLSLGSDPDLATMAAEKHNAIVVGMGS